MTQVTMAELIARWDGAEGRPFKGSLIDMDAWREAPDNIGCMCAQGQVLHLIGGLSPDDLARIDQSKADKETARLLRISVAHAVLLRTVNDREDGAPSIVLTAPEKVLGDQAERLLDFWWHLDTISYRRRQAAWDAARDAARDAAWASNEVQGARLLRERGQPFFFLPLYGLAEPENIPPRPADYGTGASA